MKKLFLLTAIITLIIVPNNLHSQTVWEETFNDLTDGTTVDNGTTKWSYTGSPTGYAEVRSGKFEVNNSDNEIVWTSETIDISSYTDVKISVALSTAMTNEMEDNDYIRVYYKLNGGAEILLSNGNNENDFSYMPAAQCSALNGSTLQIVVKIIESYTDETHYIDHVRIFEDNETIEPNGANTVWAIQSGDWNDTDTWSTGSVPDQNSDVRIGCGMIVNLDSNEEVEDLIVYNGGMLRWTNNSRTLDIKNGGTVHIKQGGAINYNGHTDAIIEFEDAGSYDLIVEDLAFGLQLDEINITTDVNLTISGGGAFYITDDFEYNGDNATVTNNLTGTFWINEDIEFNGGNNNNTFTNNGIITIDGRIFFDSDNCTFTNNGTLNINTEIQVNNGGDDGNVVNNIGTLNNAGDIEASNSDLVVNNSGTIDMEGRFWEYDGDGVVNNLAGATWYYAGSDFDSDLILNANTAGSTFIYDNSGNQDIIPTTDGYNDVIFANSGIKEIQTDLTVNGNLSIQDSAILNPDTNNNNILLGGNWTNTSDQGALSFDEGTGTETVYFIGAGNQTVTNTNGETFNNLTITKNTGNVIFNQDVLVDNELTMNSGDIDMQTNRLNLGTGTGNPGTLNHTGGSIIGEFERWLTNTATEYTFPIGDDNFDATAYITFNNLTNGTLLVEFIPTDPGSSGLPLTDGSADIIKQFTEGYWIFKAQNSLATNNFDIKLDATNFDDYPLIPATRIVSRNGAANWTTDGTHVDLANNIAQRTGLTNGISTTGTHFALGQPDVPVFHNTGGSGQIVFNNAHISDATPVFLISAYASSSYNRMKVEINTAANFGGTAYTQTFSGTYNSGDVLQFECNATTPAFSPVENTTYYARAAFSTDGGTSWSDWSVGTWSFTYNSLIGLNTEWLQTSTDQFNATAMRGGVSISGGSITGEATLTMANQVNVPLKSGGFETLNGWYYYEIGDNDFNDGGQSTAQNTEGTYSYLLDASANLDRDSYCRVMQSFDMNAFDDLYLDIYIDASNDNDHLIANVLVNEDNKWSEDVRSNNAKDEVWQWNQYIDISSYTGNNSLALEFFTFDNHGGATRRFYTDNIRLGRTIVSQPIYFASFSNAINWEELKWEETGANGDFHLTIQKLNNGIWEDVPAFSNLDYSAVPVDITTLGTEAVIRLVGKFTYSGGSPSVSWWSVRPNAVPPDNNSYFEAPVAQLAAGTVSSLADTQGEAVDVFKFNITDAVAGDDGLETKITQISLKPAVANTADWTDHIQGVLIDKGTMGSVSITDTEIIIPVSGLDITDDQSSEITFSVYLNTTNLVDNAILQFMIDANSHNCSADEAGSGLLATFSADVVSNQFTIDIDATELVFNTQPPASNAINATVSPSPIVQAQDANGNIDIDYNGTVSLTNSGSLTFSGNSATASAGIATFSSLTFTQSGGPVTLATSNADGLTNATSTAITIFNDMDSYAHAPTSQISATTIASTVTASGAAADVFRFRISDLGTSDGLPTNITQITLKPGAANTANWTNNIQGVTLSAGTVSGLSITDTEIVITVSGLSIADGATALQTIGVYLNTANIQDGGILQFMIDADNHGFTANVGGSQFAPDFGSDVVSNQFDIEVTATKLAFATEPSTNASIDLNLDTPPVVQAQDANGNIDTDFSGNVTLSNSDALGMNNYIVAAVAGEADFTSLQFTEPGGPVTLSTSNVAGLTNATTSVSITITNIKELSWITVNQASTADAYAGTSNNEVLRLDVSVTGAGQALLLNSIEIASNNSADTDISGVKLFATSTTTFETTNQISAINTFSGGKVVLSSINYDLPPNGMTYIWVAFDVNTTASYCNHIDGIIEANKIDIGGTTYPLADANPAGVRNITGAPVTLPWFESFDDVEATSLTASTTCGIDGIPEWNYDQTNTGRLNFDLGTAFAYSGSTAATLNATGDGTNYQNYITAEIDLSNYTSATDLELSFWFMDHDDESHNGATVNASNDKVWIRGSNTDTWVEIYYLNPGSITNGIWTKASGLDIDATLAAAGQTVSSTFQVRFGQYDNYMTDNTTSTDGITFDDITIERNTPPPPPPCTASTNINTDETWTLACSPYYIYADTDINSNATLTIEAGVVVIFMGPYHLQVSDGTILANGTEDMPITFTAFDTEQGWEGIRFSNTTSPTSVFEHCDISYGYNPGDGGAVFIDGGNIRAEFHDCYVHHNQCESNGGGFYLEGASSNVIINGCEISYNRNAASAGGGGAGIYINNGNPQILNSFIHNNEAYNNDGGGILCNGSVSSNIINCIIVNNKAGDWGGGINFYSANDNARITNCIIARNVADEGGGVFSYQSDPEFYNTIVWGNYATNGSNIYLEQNSADPILEYCIVEGGTSNIPGDGGGTNYTGSTTGTIDANPLFINPTDDVGTNYDASLADWHYQSTSPARDAGNNGAPNVPATDFDGNARIINTTVDIGAYEYLITPTVTTAAIVNITTNSASGGGEVVNDNGSSVTARGVCWNSSGTPTIADSRTTNGSGTGVFGSNLTGLAANTTYYVRAYATNANGTGYGDMVTFTTASNKPVLTTQEPFFITTNSVESGGNITDEGTSAVTARGVCWNTSGSPTIADNFTDDGAGTGVFQSVLPGLTNNTTYYVKAYATNSSGTSYGEEYSFETSFGVLYVTETGAGLMNGSSWANAFATVQDALDAATVDGYEIWVAAGTYYPEKDAGGSASPADPRDKTFVLKNNTALYGSFAGTEIARSDRILCDYETILSGDIGIQGDETDNAYHVITNYNNGADATAIIDGFTIRDGNANGGGFSDCGGAILNHNTSPTIYNCLLKENKAVYGGAVYNSVASPVFKNTVFTDNTAYAYGGAVYNYTSFSEPEFQNCDFVANTALTVGDGVYNSYATATIENSILWNNGTEIYNDPNGGAVSLTYSIVNGGYSGSGNVNQDPEFLDEAAGDFHLTQTSPAINEGNPSTSDMLSLDFTGSPRIYDGVDEPDIIDMGVCEYQGEPLNRRPGFVDAGAQTVMTDSYLDMELNYWDVDEEDTHTVTVTSNNANLLIQNLTLFSYGATYKIVPVSGWTGVANVTVTVKDDSGQSNDTRTETYTVTVSEGVCGHITENTTWSEPVVKVQCDVTIDEGVTLTIDPGVTVEFQGHYNIFVKGRLVAEGTEVDSVKFTVPKNPDGSASAIRWAGIRFQNVTPPAAPKDTSKFVYCLFEYSHAKGSDEEQNGGAVYIDNFNRVYINQSNFEYNTANFKGGGIYINSAHPIVTSTAFRHNSAYDGGGLFFNNTSSITMYNNLIANNTATNNGGGIFAFNNSNPDAINNTIVNNSAGNDGGGFYCEGYNDSEFRNTILWGNTASSSGSQVFIESGYYGRPNFYYCDIQGGSGAFGGAGSAATYSNNINSDPLFTDASAEDYSIPITSPCYNTGDPATDITLFPKDLNRNPRIINGQIDIGCYEFMETVIWTAESATDNEDWFQDDNWSTGAAPIETNNVLIPQHPTGGDIFPTKNSNPNTGLVKGAHVYNLTIEANARVVVPEGQVLTVDGTLYQDGTLILNNGYNSSASFINNGPVFYGVGDSTLVRRRLTGNKWHYISLPVTSFNSNLFINELTSPYFNANLYTFNETVQEATDWREGWQYAYKVTSTHSNGYPKTGTGIDMNIGVGYAYLYDNWAQIDLMGDFNYGDITIPVSHSNNGVNSDGWNLIGNPYPATIDADAFLDANNTVINGALYFWDEDASNGTYESSDYATWTKAGAVGFGLEGSDGVRVPDGKIAVAQSFFVRKLSAGTDDVVFKNTMRQFETGKGTFFKSTSEEKPMRITLSAVNSKNQYNETMLAFTKAGTTGFDKDYDAHKNKGFVVTSWVDYGKLIMAFYSMDAENEYAIQALPENIDEQIVPLGIQSDYNETYTIKITKQENIPDGTVVILRDKVTGAETNLTQENYTVSLAKGAVNDRFELIFTTPHTFKAMVSDNWEDAQNWDKGTVPTATDKAYIPVGQKAIINTNAATCYSLVVEAGGAVEIGQGAKLTIETNVLLKEDENGIASLLETGNLLVKETSIVETYFKEDKSKFISTSVKEKKRKDVVVDKLEKFNTLTKKHESVSDDEQLKTAKGYRAINNGKDIKSVVSGDLNTGLIVTDVITNPEGKSMNFVGNPYPAGLDVYQFLNRNKGANGSINGTVYLPNENSKTTGGFGAINQSGTVNAPQNGLLSPQQAFFVQANKKGKVTFDNSMKRSYSKYYFNPDVPNTERLKIAIENATNTDETLLAFNENATIEFDSDYDALKIEYPDILQMYSLAEFGECAIQGFDEQYFDKEIKLGVRSKAEETHTLKLAGLSMPSDVNIYLVDSYFDRTINLREQSNYTYTAESDVENERFVIRFIKKSVWNGSVSNHWNETQNWSNGIPDAQTDAYIPENFSVKVAENARCFNLEISPNSDVIIEKSGSLKVDNTLQLKAGNGVPASIIDIGDLQVKNNAIAEINLLKDKTNFVAVPVKNAHKKQLQNTEMNRFDEQENTWKYLDNDERLDVAKGYKLETSENQIAAFEGKLNSGEIDIIATSYSQSQNKGLNLIGNPYPSAILAENFVQKNAVENNNITGALYFWDETKTDSYHYADYAVWTNAGYVNAGTSTQFNGNIVSGSSFFIQTLKTSEIAFDNSMRVANTYQPKNKSLNKVVSVKLNIIKATEEVFIKNQIKTANQLLVAFTEEATKEYDAMYDAYKLRGNDYLSFYSYKGAEKFAIQALPALGYTTVTVPLAVEAAYTGRYTISVEELSNLHNKAYVILEDRKTKREYDLKINPEVVVEMEQKSAIGRFVLHIGIEEPRHTTWIGSLSNNWYDTQNWTNGVPDDYTVATIEEAENLPLVNNQAVCYHLIINSGGIEINKAAQLTVTGNLQMKTLQNATTAIIEYGNLNVEGEISIEKYVPANQQVFISSPVESTAGSLFQNTEFKLFNENNDTWITVNSNMLDILYGYNATNFDNKSKTFVFKGTLNNGQFELPLTAYNKGWNLLGNPYPSPIDWNAENGWQRSNLGHTLYKWSGTNYTYYNRMLDISINNGSRYILPGEGFFVNAFEKGRVSISDDARVLKTNKQSGIAQHNGLLRIRISEGTQTDETIVLKYAEASTDFDHAFDAYKLLSNTNVPQIFTTTNNVNYALNTQPFESKTPKLLLGVSGTNNRVTIGIVENTFDSEYLYLKDLFTNSVINLKETNEYTFSATGMDDYRFELLFYEQSTTINSDNSKDVVMVYTSKKNVFVAPKLHTNNEIQVDIYTASGAKIHRQEVVNNQKNVIETEVATGVYFVKITAGDKQWTRQVVVE